MIHDLDDSPTDALPEYDLCVVGSGPAGATVAAELADSRLRICVLECGRQRTARHHDALRHVDSRGIQIKEYSRERVLGGASTTWAGLSSPLDPIDLAPREWLPHSGWPLGPEDLAPYYAAAAARYRFPGPALFEPGGFDVLRAKSPLQPDWDALDEKVFLASAEPQDFGKEQRAIYDPGPVDLYLDASVLRLERSDDPERGDCIGRALLRTRSGREFTLRARAFVLATGGIENARLLLQSTDLSAAGLGNQRDQVGRYLMNHPKNYRGILHLAEPVEDAPYYFGCLQSGYAGYAGLHLPERIQSERRLLNSYVRLEPLFPWSDSQGVEAFVLLVKRSVFILRSFRKRSGDKLISLKDYSETGDDTALQNERKGLFQWLGLLGTIALDAPKVARYVYHRVSRARTRITQARLRNFMEMEPVPENRVTLGVERDSNGQPVPVVTHAPTELDRRSLLELQAALASEFERAGIGRLDSDLATTEPWPIDQDASHHMGTTRMGTDPATSVVTPELRLHDVPNVYLAGASVFPTSGCANPTFTIVALSIRLAEHLGREVFGPEASA